MVYDEACEECGNKPFEMFNFFLFLTTVFVNRNPGRHAVSRVDH